MYTEQQYLDHHGRVVVGGVELIELQEGQVRLQVVTWGWNMVALAW